MEMLVAALEAAASGSMAKEAETYLQQAETQFPGFYPSLQRIYLGQHMTAVSEPARILAAITLKNGMERYWRRSAKHALSAEDKQQIKSALLQGCRQDIPALVSTQNAVVVGRIARQEFPNDWPNLFEDLLQAIMAVQHEEDALIRHLRVLNQVVKALSSVRMTRQRDAFQRAVPPVLSCITQAYEATTANWLRNGENAAMPSDHTLLIADLALKIARRLVCHGYEHPYTDDTCRHFFSLAASHIDPLWQLVAVLNEEDTSPSAQRLRSHLVHAGKFFLELSSSSMESYAMNYAYVLMPGSMQLVKTYWSMVVSAADSPHTTIRKVVVQGLILIKQSVKLVAMPKTNLRVMRGKESADLQAALHMLETDLFAPSSLGGIFEALVTRFLLLRREDLEHWEADPEEWLALQEEGHWQFEVRPCAEKVLLDFFGSFKTQLREPLMQVLQQTAGAQQGDALLMKEALYNALGIAAPHLYDHFDFDGFLPVLEGECADPVRAPIFKRRILVLISQWVTVQCKASSRPSLYRMIGSQLDAADPCLALAAAFAVQPVTEEWDFAVEAFLPFSKHFVLGLLKILAEHVEQAESKMKILTSLGILCERTGTHLGAEELDALLAQIPQEWNKLTTGNEHLVKVALLGLLSRLVLSLRGRSALCYPLVLPLIQYSTDPTNFEHVYLMEESLELWHATLQNATEPRPELLQLFPIALTALPQAGENLKKILYIIESSILLLGDGLAQAGYAGQLAESMISQLPGLKADALSHFCRVLGLGAQVWTPAYLSDALIIQLTRLCIAAPQRGDNLITVCYLCLISQLVLAEPRRLTQSWSSSGEPLLQQFVQCLFEHFDNIGHPKYRKQGCMALTCLLQSGDRHFSDPTVVAQVGNVWEDVLAECQANGDDLVYWVEDANFVEDLAEEAPEMERRKAVSAAQAVCQVRLKEYIRQSLPLVDASLLGASLNGLLQ
ncbi:armadillo-type protein [Protomyces lactucae-debilis]|uniref:Armadillo-type protein n=1 Tax=Protomyces lactucae-debilis TaxID=2754530 RepID=A0A1Y2FCA5_PROLT|nr:armadillo-type protein [Protomyces lactucae-debilis]ORY80485.1 armadillo-type protein [Protomyces lactucae-debilis]